MTRRRLQLHTKQLAFHNSGAFVRGFVGGIGSGKSHVGAFDLLVRAWRKPGYYGVLAPTFPILKKASWRSLLACARSLGWLARHNRSEPSVVLKNGAEVVGLSADDPDRLRGPNMRGIWVDEASIQKEEAYQVAVGRLREGGERGWITATFTPKGRLHWTYKTFALDPAAFLTHCKTWESPFAPPDLIAYLISQYGSYLALQELEGAFLDPQGAVFQGKWFGKYHDIGDAYRLPGGRVYRKEECWRLLVCDPAESTGDDADYTAILAVVVTPARDLLVVDCVRERLGVERIVPELRRLAQHWDPLYLAFETVGFQSAVANEARKVLKVPVRAVKPQGKSKLVRAQRAVILAEQGKIYLPQAAPWLDAFLAEILTFTGEKDGVDDQCLAAGTLVETAAGPVPIEHVRPGDMVLTRRGFSPVLASRMTQRSARVMTVDLGAGRFLTGTPNHPVFVVGKGFVRLDSLGCGDMMLGCDQNARATSFAAATAPQPTDELPASMTLTAPAHNAARCSGPTSIRRSAHAPSLVLPVRHVRPEPQSVPVFNLTVEGENEYFANGVLVHNCDALAWAAIEAGRVEPGGKSGGMPRALERRPERP